MDRGKRMILRQSETAVVFVCSKGGGAYWCIHVVYTKGMKLRIYMYAKCIFVLKSVCKNARMCASGQ